MILTCFGTKTKVTRIIDGDTFETETGEKVRLIGINAPEISDIFGIEAKLYLASLIDQKIVELQTDKISNNQDRYSRLLRYVFVDKLDVNKKMLLEGFATAYLKYNFIKSEEYRKAQLTASSNHFGMWGNNNKAQIKERKKDKMINTRKISFKMYFIGFVFLFLICFGIYYSVKK